MRRRTSSRQSHQPILVRSRLAQISPQRLQAPPRRRHQHRSQACTDKHQRCRTQTATREQTDPVRRTTRSPRVPCRTNLRMDQPRQGMEDWGTLRVRSGRNTANSRRTLEVCGRLEGLVSNQAATKIRLPWMRNAQQTRIPLRPRRP